MIAQRRAFLLGRQHFQGERPDRRPMAGERHGAGLAGGGGLQQHLDLLPTTAALTRTHPRTRQALHLILIQRTVGRERLQIAPAGSRVGNHCAKIARRLEIDQLAPRHFLALTDAHIEPAGGDLCLHPDSGALDAPIRGKGTIDIAPGTGHGLRESRHAE